VYAVRLENRVYVLHAFQKKSKKGIKTPKHVINLIEARRQEAERMQAELEAQK
jgi:phage-related protein